MTTLRETFDRKQGGSPIEFEHLETVGFMANHCRWPEVPEQVPPHEDTYNYLLKCGYDEELLSSYQQIKSSTTGLAKAVKHLDLPVFHSRYDELLDSDAAADACCDVLDRFVEFENTQPIIDLYDCRVNRDATSGVLEGMIGADDTGKLVDNFLQHVKIFWECAHVYQHVSLQKLTLKEELLPKKKVIENNPRSFNPCSKLLMLNVNRMFYGVHVAMCARANDPKFPVKVGFSPQQGGFSALMRECAKHPYKYKGDYSKFDKTLVQLYYHILLNLAYKVWDKKSMSKEEWFQRAHYYISCVSLQTMMLPNGQVIKVGRGNPSGWYLTTDLNCVANLFCFSLHYRRFCSMSLVASGDFVAMYADDNLGSTEYPQIAHTPNRVDTADLSGFTSKPEDNYEGDDIEEEKFLGMWPKWSVDYSRYVPMFEKAKILCSACRPDDPTLSDDAQLTRIASLMSLVCFDDELWKVLHDYAVILMNRGAFVVETDYTFFIYNFKFSRVPTRAECIAHWLGQQQASFLVSVVDEDGLASHYGVLDHRCRQELLGASVPWEFDKRRAHHEKFGSTLRELLFPRPVSVQGGNLNIIQQMSKVKCDGPSDLLNKNNKVAANSSQTAKSVQTVPKAKAKAQAQPQARMQLAARGTKKTTTVVTRVQRSAQPQVTRGQRSTAKKNARAINAPSRRNTEAGVLQNEFKDVVQKIAAQLCMPVDFSDPERFGSEYTSSDTAVVRPFERSTLPVDSTNTTQQNYQQLPPEENFVASFRNILRSEIVYDPNTARDEFDYAWRFTGPDTGNTISSTISFPISDGVVETAMHPIYAESQETYSPHTATQYCGKVGSDPKRYFWIDATEAAEAFINLTATVPIESGGEVKIYVWRYDPTGVSRLDTLTATLNGSTTTETITLTQSGYYALTFVANIVAVGGTFTINHTGNSSTFRHLPAPDFDQHKTSVMTSFVQAKEIMISNKSAMIELSGDITAYQAPKGSNWQTWLDYATVSGANGAYVGNLKDGCHGHMLPGQPEDFNLVPTGQILTTAYLDMAYELVNASGFMIFMTNCINPEGRQFRLLRACIVQFETDSTWYDVAPGLSPDIWKEALAVIRNMPQFHTNAAHQRSIWSWIKEKATAFIKAVAQYGPAVGKAAIALASVL